MNLINQTKKCCQLLGILALLGAVSCVWAVSGVTIEEVDPSLAGRVVLPKLQNQAARVYPDTLKNSGVEGIVNVLFTVDDVGQVKEVELGHSPASVLVPIALEEVSTWHFVPGFRDGKQVTFRLRAALEYFDGKPVQTASYEVAPAVKRLPTPVYPYDMLIKGKKGWAEASFTIDYAGRPLFAATVGATDQEFAKSVIAMVEASEFVPGKRDHHAVLSPSNQRYQFDPEAGLDSGARRVLAELRKEHPAIYAIHELDERPRPVRQDSPVYPRALKDDGLTGQADVEFIVDRDGRVLFPRVVSATHEDFGWAAATAVSQWRFQPPTKDGQHVEVRMTVPILFDSGKLAASD